MSRRQEVGGGRGGRGVVVKAGSGGPPRACCFGEEAVTEKTKKQKKTATGQRQGKTESVTLRVAMETESCENYVYYVMLHTWLIYHYFKEV